VSQARGLLLSACLAPAAVVFAAFWLLPMAWLVMLPAAKGWQTYFAVLSTPRYLQSLINTVLLSVSVTLATLVIGAAVGLFLARTPFRGRGCCCRC
jgi:putative spermidine/putrescine transport system permease protein